MLDVSLRRLMDRPLEAMAAQISRTPISASALVVAGFACGLGAIGCIAAHRPVAGLGFVVVKLLLEGTSAPLARITGQSPLTAYLGVIFDFLVRAGIPLAFALADPSRALAAAFLIMSFVGTGTARLADRAFAIGDGRRSLSVPGGLIETMIVYVAFALACLVPAWFSVLAYALGMLCFVLTGASVASAIERLK